MPLNADRRAWAADQPGNGLTSVPTPATGASRTFLAAVAGTSATQVVLVAYGFVTGLLYARILGTSGRGEFALFQNAGAFLLIVFGLGMSSAVSYAVSSGRLSVRGSLRSVSRLYAGSAIGAAIVVAAAAWTGLRGVLPTSLGAAVNVFALTLYVGLTQLSAVLTGVLIARQSFGAMNATSLIVGLAGVLLLAALTLLPVPMDALLSVIAVVLVIEGLRLSMLAIYVLRQGWLQTDKSIGRRPTRSGMTRYTALSAGADILQFLNYRADVWFLGVLGSLSALGVYALSVSMAELVWIVPSAAGRVLFPEAARDPIAARALTSKTAILCFVLSAALGLGGWLASLTLVVPLFGADFSDAASLIGILLLGIVPFSAAKILGTHFAGANALHRNIAASAFTLPVMVALNLTLVPIYGAHGAATATAVAYAAQTAILVAFWRRDGRGNHVVSEARR